MKVESWPWNTTSYSTFTREELLTRYLSLDNSETWQNKRHDGKTCLGVGKTVCAARRDAVQQPCLTEIIMKIWRYDLILRVLDCTVLWLFHLVCILYCGCFNLFCDVCVSVCVGSVMCTCFDNCVGVLVICLLVLTVFCIICTVFLYCFVYVYFCFVCTSVRTTATEWKLNCK